MPVSRARSGPSSRLVWSKTSPLDAWHRHARPLLDVGLSVVLLCGCAANQPTPVYPNTASAVGNALIGGLIGNLIGEGRGAAIGADISDRYVRVARAVLYRDDQDGGYFSVFSYLIAAQKDPNSPVGQRLRAAIDAYAQGAPYCPSGQVNPSRFNIFIVPVTSVKPADADQALCKNGIVVATLLFSEYD